MIDVEAQYSDDPQQSLAAMKKMSFIPLTTMHRFLSGDVPFWYDSNQRIFRMSKVHCTRKIKVWAVFFGESITGPLFYRDILSDDSYLKILKGI